VSINLIQDNVKLLTLRSKHCFFLSETKKIQENVEEGRFRENFAQNNSKATTSRFSFRRFEERSRQVRRFNPHSVGSHSTVDLVSRSTLSRSRQGSSSSLFYYCSGCRLMGSLWARLFR